MDTATRAREPFHEGEREVQERAGERSAAVRAGVIVAAALPPGARRFLVEVRTLAVATLDECGAPCASVLFGPTGFVSSEDGASVVLRRGTEAGAWPGLRVGSDVSLLAIDLETRRRFRVNGVVRASDPSGVEVGVREAYPNCRKYVQARRWLRDEVCPSSAAAETTVRGKILDGPRCHVVAAADTLFVASRHPEWGADVSHRGGEPGFVRIVDPGCLRIPDYPGNSMFNTLGNFRVDDRGGLAFIDFERGRLLQARGTVMLRLDGGEDAGQPTGGTGRYWDFHVTSWVDAPIVPRPRWGPVDPSPHNPGAR